MLLRELCSPPGFNFTGQGIRPHAEARQQGRDDAILLRDERAQ
jgi:hypothetical protein